MPAPDAPRGTRPHRDLSRVRTTDDGRKTINSNKNKGASSPGTDGRGNQAANPKAPKNAKPIEALNPPFDPRMRRIGSPLNLSGRVKRGWIQSERGRPRHRVNFLFNPAQIDLNHQFDSSVPTREQRETIDQGKGLRNFLATTGSSLSLQLLYDRTYELFSPPKAGKSNFANQFGVYADVAAWYTYLNMLEEMPTTWDESMITGPAVPRESFLFIGQRLVFYGWITGISVTYAHWNQHMVPARCSVGIQFTILPNQVTPPLPGYALRGNDGGNGWARDWEIGGSPGTMPRSI